MYCKRAVSCVVLVAALAGCGVSGLTGTPGPNLKFDGTTLETQQESSRKMVEGLPEAEKKAFFSDMTTVAFGKLAAEGKAATPNADELFRSLHGMTKVEIEDKAREIRAREGAGAPAPGGGTGK